jgi:hypothetical protein
MTGLAALPAGLGFGILYQDAGASTALVASAGGMLLAVAWWIVATRRPLAPI